MGKTAIPGGGKNKYKVSPCIGGVGKEYKKEQSEDCSCAHIA
jgi:hypothetical protein